MTDEKKASNPKKSRSWFRSLKLRLTLGGAIVSIIGLILMGVRGFSYAYLVLLIIGIVVLLIGLFMKDKTKKV